MDINKRTQEPELFDEHVNRTQDARMASLNPQ